jgi:hypothetical protein
MRRFIFRLGSILFALTIACAIGEVALRLVGYSRSYVNPIAGFHEADYLVGWKGRPNVVGRFSRPEFNVLVAHNDLGFRRHEYQNPPEKCRHKVFVLGDSFAWGWGVDQGQVFSDRLNRLLPDCDVRNFGLDGTGTVQQFAIFGAHVRDQLSPGDTVVLAFFNNDFTDNVTDDGGTNLFARLENGRVVAVPPSHLAGGAWKNRLKEHSCLFNLLVYSYDRAVATLHAKHRASVLDGGAQLPDDSPAVVITKDFLGRFQQACEEKQARFVLAYIPGQAEMGESTGPSPEKLRCEATARRLLMSCVNSLHIETIDFLPDFTAARISGRFERLTFAQDQHWNANGHAVAAEVIARRLSDRCAYAPPTDAASPPLETGSRTDAVSRR